MLLKEETNETFDRQMTMSFMTTAQHGLIHNKNKSWRFLSSYITVLLLPTCLYSALNRIMQRLQNQLVLQWKPQRVTCHGNQRRNWLGWLVVRCPSLERQLGMRPEPNAPVAEMKPSSFHSCLLVSMFVSLPLTPFL